MKRFYIPSLIAIFLTLSACSDVKLFYIVKSLQDLAGFDKGGLNAANGTGGTGTAAGNLELDRSLDIPLKDIRGSGSGSGTGDVGTSESTPNNAVAQTEKNNGGFSNQKINHNIVKIEFKPFKTKLNGFKDTKTLEYVLLDKDGQEVDKTQYTLTFSSDHISVDVDTTGTVTAKNSTGTAIITGALSIDASITGIAEVSIGTSSGSSSGGGGGGGGGGSSSGGAPAPPAATPTPTDIVDGTVVFS